MRYMSSMGFDRIGEKDIGRKDILDKKYDKYPRWIRGLIFQLNR